VVLSVDDSDLQDDLVYSPMVKKDSDGLPLSVYPAPPGTPEWLLPIARRIKLVRLTMAALHKRRTRSERIKRDPRDRRLFTNRYAHYVPENEHAWAPEFSRSLALIDAIVRYCRAHEIQIAIVNYPYPPAVTRLYGIEWRKVFGLDGDRIYDPAWHHVQRRYAEAERVPYYDFTKYLRLLTDHQGIYDERDGHFSAAGNTLLAEELVRFIWRIKAGSGGEAGLDAIDGFGGLVATAEGGEAEIALAARTEARAGRAHDVSVVEQAREEVPR
jgi:hypothetical protein